MKKKPKINYYAEVQCARIVYASFQVHGVDAATARKMLIKRAKDYNWDKKLKTDGEDSFTITQFEVER